VQERLIVDPKGPVIDQLLGFEATVSSRGFVGSGPARAGVGDTSVGSVGMTRTPCSNPLCREKNLAGSTFCRRCGTKVHV
jgi:hypothetical protein